MKKTKNTKSHKNVNKTKKNVKSIIGGSFDIEPFLLKKTKNVFEKTLNYIEIHASGNKYYYTPITFSQDMKQIPEWLNYGLRPGMGGIVVDTLQPYVIYFFAYYYVILIFSEFFKKKDSFINVYSLSTGDNLTKKTLNDLNIVRGTIYYIHANATLFERMTMLDNKTDVVLKFRFITYGSSDIPLLEILDLYLVNTDINKDKSNNSLEDVLNIVNNNRNIIQRNTITLTSETINKLKTIIQYSIQQEKSIITKQSNGEEVRLLQYDGSLSSSLNKVPYIKMNDPKTTRVVLDIYPISASFLTFINKLNEAVSSTNTSITSLDNLKLSSVSEVLIPSILNIYLTTTTSSDVSLNRVLLQESMFSPYTGKSNELTINPRYDFSKLKEDLIKTLCKSSKECIVDVLYNKEKFNGFLQKHKQKKRLRTLHQVTPNVSGNISTTLSLLLSNALLKIKDDECKVIGYNWNYQWKISGPNDILINLETSDLQNKEMSKVEDVLSCFKNVKVYYDDLIDLFYPSMSGKDITKIYGNYLRVLSERNVMLNELKGVINKKTFSINASNLTQDDITKLSKIKSKSDMLNHYIHKFLENVLYQLVAIANITTKIINRIHTTCFFYFGFDERLYEYTLDKNTNFPPYLLKYIYTIADDKGQVIFKYINDILDYMYLKNENLSKPFFDSVLCSTTLKNEYLSIIRNFSNIIKVVLTKLDVITGRMLEIRDDTSYDIINVRNETLSILWISDEEIEESFSVFERSLRNFIKDNYSDDYYSQSHIEKCIDDIFWDMEKSSDYSHTRLFTKYIDTNVWVQYELLFIMKTIQVLFLIYQYTGKFLYYIQPPEHINYNSLSLNGFFIFLGDNVNLFSCVLNWFKYNCIVQISLLIETKEEISNVEMQQLFASNRNIRESYLLLRYYITQIILGNLDVCYLTTELQSFVSLLSPLQEDLNDITSKHESNETTKPSDKPDLETTQRESQKISYDIDVEIKLVKSDTDTKPNLSSSNIQDFLGCRRLDMQLKWNKLKQSSSKLYGETISYTTLQNASLFRPTIQYIKDDLSEHSVSPLSGQRIISLFTNSTEITKLITINPFFNTSDNVGSFFIDLNMFVFAINKEIESQSGDVKIRKFTSFYDVNNPVVKDATKRIFGIFSINLSQN
jgi:hypothetical protein